MDNLALLLGNGTYLNDLVDLLVLPLVRLGHLLPARDHVVVAVVPSSIVVWGRVNVWAAVWGIMPLVVGSSGICLEAVGWRGCPRRRALVRVHDGRPPAGTEGHTGFGADKAKW